MPEESTTPDLLKLVRHLLHAASRMGGDGFVRSFAPDAVFLTGVGRFEGREVVVTHAGGVVSQWTDYATIDEARAAAERLAEERG